MERDPAAPIRGDSPMGCHDAFSAVGSCTLRWQLFCLRPPRLPIPGSADSSQSFACATTPRSEATKEDGRGKDAEPRRETRRRVRKIVERHRETFDELAK